LVTRLNKQKKGGKEKKGRKDRNKWISSTPGHAQRDKIEITKKNASQTEHSRKEKKQGKKGHFAQRPGTVVQGTGLEKGSLAQHIAVCF